MNNTRRKAIDAVTAALIELRSQLDTLRDEEQDYYDNMPDSFRDGEKGEVSQAALDNIDNALTSIEEAEDALTEAIV